MNIPKLRFLFSSVTDWVVYLRYANRPYVEYYRAIMRRRTKTDAVRAVGAADVGHRQVERLKMHGLLPEHTVFDIGCGNLRGGEGVIRYLNKCNYYGNDISKDILEDARERLGDLAVKEPHLYLTNDMEFSEVKGKTFDYVHAQSVLSHMPPGDIEMLFKNLRSIMRPGTICLFSYLPSKSGEIYPSQQMKNFHYPFEWFVAAGATCGLKVEKAEDMPEYTGKQPIMKITLT